MSQSTSGLLDNLAREIGGALGRLGLPPERMEQAVRDAIRPVLDRMDLVTREEFDRQQQDLETTLKRVEQLEAQLGIQPGERAETHFNVEPLANDPEDPSTDWDPNEPRK
ncbi:accessory factor UbiK family protein [Thiohalorhabdus methylotrophus]|uniref:Accessory factor UbiK family protein n=1 Tax=Thiohalorhabdus methylotrophus TaxID=3242694 RepID=A0ABV4TQ19_9GAMM